MLALTHTFKVYRNHEFKASECSFTFSYPVSRAYARKRVKDEGYIIVTNRKVKP